MEHKGNRFGKARSKLAAEGTATIGRLNNTWQNMVLDHSCIVPGSVSSELAHVLY